MASPGGHLQLLPLELKIRICEFLCDHCTAGWHSSSSDDNHVFGIGKITSKPLLKLCLTSKMMRDAAQPVLFHFFTAYGIRNYYSLFTSRGMTPQKRKPALSHLDNLVVEIPHLFKQTKSLSITFISVTSCVHSRALKTQEPDSGSGQYFRVASKLLESAIKLEELEISIEEGWIPGDISLPQLKELSLHYRPTPEGSELSAAITSSLLKNKPLLRKLTLTNRQWFDHTISGTLHNLREFCMINTRTHDNAPIIGTSGFFKAMPQLESFTLRDVDFRGELEGSINILRGLLACKHSLKSLRLDCCIRHSGGLLRKFYKLENLNFFICRPHAVGRYPRFPHSLQRLVIQHRLGLRSLSEAPLNHLSTKTGRYPNLKAVQELIHPTMFPTERFIRQRRALANRNMAPKFEDVGIDFWAEVNDRQRPGFIGRSWGRNIEACWVEGLHLIHGIGDE